MKRCQKCSRTYPDENQRFCTFDGGLLLYEQPAAPPFDPNLTVRATSKGLVPPTHEIDASEAPTSVQLPNLDATITSFGTGSFSQTPATHEEDFIGGQASADLPAPPPAPTADISPAAKSTAPGPAAPAPNADILTPAQPTSRPLAPPVTPGAPPKKRSALPWILAGLVALLLLGGGGATALFFLVVKPRLDARNERPVSTNTPTPANENANTNTNTNTANTNTETNTSANSELSKEPESFSPPADALKFTNAKDNLDGKLAEHYVDFSFYYLNSWIKDPKAGGPGATSFVRVERRLPPDLTQENVAVGWYDSKGTFELDKDDFPRLVQSLSVNYASRFPSYRKLSEGPTKVNSLDAYEFRFEGLSKGTDQGDIKLWGRVIFLPRGIDGQNSGVTLFMFTTSLAPELAGVDDVGVKGELSIILNSFRFGASR
jgi:hypothetical protein